MFRSDILIPGSDFLLAGLARIALVVAIVALGVIAAKRAITRLRKRPSGRPVPTPGPGLTAEPGHAAGPRQSALPDQTALRTDQTALRSQPAEPRRDRRFSRPLKAFTTLGVIGLVATALTWPPSVEVPEFPALPKYLLPKTALFYRPVTDLPTAPDSDKWVDALGAMPVFAPFGGRSGSGNVAGVPFNVVDDSTPRIDVKLTQYRKNAFAGPYPISNPAWIEGFFAYGNDQHYLAIDPGSRRAWELIATRRWFSRWEAGSGSTWSMDSLDYPTGATIVARLPFLPGVIRYDEVASGSVDHLILAGSKVSARGRFIWPARSTDGVSDDPNAPPMGAWMRLKPDADLSGLGSQATVIARAAQRYGILISDTGPRFTLRGTPDRRWDTKDLRTLTTLSTDDFEFVDVSGIMISPDSLEVAQPAG